LKKTVGIANPEALNNIKIEPITDVFNFVGGKEANLELIKLMAEDGELSKIIEDPVTSKNYPNHSITIATNKPISKESVIDPLLKFFENSDYFKKIQAESIQNLNKKMVANDSIITQIDLVINTISNKKASVNDKLMYYNENTQLNEIIATKNGLVIEQGSLAINKINIDKIVKESSVSINLLNTKSLNGKLKLILPFLLVLLFILLKVGQRFYNSQLEKYNKQ
jgi:delta 1-pyrroline-5-carboxylate dehydrogenase